MILYTIAVYVEKKERFYARNIISVFLYNSLAVHRFIVVNQTLH